MANLAIAELAVIVPERRRRRQEHVQQAAERPDVTAEAVRLTHDDLGRRVPRGADFKRSRVCG